MKQLNKKQLLKYGGIAALCLILLPIFPLVLGAYLAYRLYRRTPNRKKGMAFAVLTVVISFFLTGVTVSAFPSSSPKTTPTPTPTIDASQNAQQEATVPSETITPTSEIKTNEQIQKGQTESGTVVKVIDGDTLDVSINGKTERIRVIGVDTPETVDPRKSVQCFGVEASNQAKAKLQIGATVELEADTTQGERDKYQRLLRYIWINGQDFGLSQIQGGYAHEYTYNTPYKYQSSYKQAQKDAESGKKGLWADNACVATPKPTAKPTTAPQSNVAPPANTSGYSCTGPDLDCSDFSTHAQAQSFFNSCGFTADYDPMKLDSVGVGDGVACESLP